MQSGLVGPGLMLLTRNLEIMVFWFESYYDRCSYFAALEISALSSAHPCQHRSAIAYLFDFIRRGFPFENDNKYANQSSVIHLYDVQFFLSKQSRISRSVLEDGSRPWDCFGRNNGMDG